MSAMAYQITGLLEKMSSSDKDYRFMATNDLMTELQNDSIKLDDDSERKVVRMLLRLLEDKNGEVQNLAVKCLGPLVHKVKEPQAESIVDTLCSNMISGSEQLRDVSSIALKTVISELPPSNASLTSNVIKRVVPKLTDALKESASTEASVRIEVLDIVSDVLLRYGSTIAAHHEQLQEVLFTQLASERQALRKRSVVALGNLMAVSPPQLYAYTMKMLIKELTTPNASVSQVRTLVQTVQCVCKCTGSRFAPHLPLVVPLLVTFAVSTEDDELRESCIQAFESFIFRCPKDIVPFVPEIGKVISEFLKHDPNYTYDDDESEVEEGANMDTDGGDTEDDDDETNEYSDDDDMSWKVRRASAKCIEALILSHRENIGDFLSKLGPLLISRFKEREDNVKWDIFHAYTAILSQIRSLIPNFSSITLQTDSEKGEGHESCGDVETVRIGGAVVLKSAASHEQIAVLQALDAQVPMLVKAINRQLRTKTLKTKQCCFILLTQLLRAYPGALSDQLHLLVSGVASAMSDRSSNTNMKIDTLSFLSVALCSHPPEKLHPHMSILVPLIVRAVSDSFYKVSAEALTVTLSLIRVLRPSHPSACLLDFTPFVSAIYDAVADKLKATDIDQEVKEKAITSTGLLIATFGDFLSDKLPACLPILLERLRNEMTRLVTVKALTTIVNSPLKINLGAILPDVLPLLAEFLRKNQRALKIATLGLLDSLTTKYAHGGLDGEGMQKILAETPALVTELDLQISQLALNFVADMMGTHPKLIPECLSKLLSAFVLLSQSSLLQGATLTSALNLLDALMRNPVPNKPSLEELLDELTAPVFAHVSLPRQAYHSISACTAVVASASGDLSKSSRLAKQLAQQLRSPDTADGVRLFSLLTLGELGRKCPQVYENDPSLKPEELLVDAFNSSSEELKAAASYSLGMLAVGNLETFLPFLLKQISSQPKRQYLLLHALKEVIGSESVDARAMEFFRPRIEQIWPVLMEHAVCPEEGTRNVVAECLGKLCLVHPESLLPRLKGCATSKNALMRASAVTAVKFLIVEQWTAADDMLQCAMAEFLQTVTDSDLNVRRVALVAFNSAAHNKPKLIRDLLDMFLPSLYAETVVKKELVREVEMGPFKHTVDDGLDLRKAAFECMYTLLETCLERLDVFEFMTHMESGLKDHHDIKLLTCLMLARLASLCPTQVLQRLDRLCEPLKAQLQSKTKANAVKQESDKQEELRRAALRAVLALHHVPDAERQQQFAELLTMIRSSPELNALYQSVERDATHRSFTAESIMETD
uniref:TATA-binding protein interacting (TIP20) domain-containing protein n=8 Tax=Parascaris univalens TaxID=6257 RepID=A0A914ZPD0_PARUN